MSKLIGYAQLNNLAFNYFGNECMTVYVDKDKVDVLDEIVMGFSPDLNTRFGYMKFRDLLPLVNELKLNIRYISRTQLNDKYLLALSCLAHEIPYIENDEIGSFYMDFSYIRDFDEEKENVVKSIRNEFENIDFDFGVGPNKWLAFLSSKNPEFGIDIAKVPVSLLPVDESVKNKLMYFDINFLGDISTLGFDRIHHQFGETGVMIWNLSKGRGEDMIVPIKNENFISELIEFSYPVNDMSIIYHSLNFRLKKMFSGNQMNQKGVRSINLRIGLDGDNVSNIEVHSKDLFIDFKKTVRIILNKINNLKIYNGIVYMHVTFKNIVSFKGTQLMMFKNDNHENQLKSSLDQLKEHMGEDVVYKIREVEDCPDIPEKKFLKFPLSA